MWPTHRLIHNHTATSVTTDWMHVIHLKTCTMYPPFFFKATATVNTIHLTAFLGRLFDQVDLIKPVSNVHPSVHTWICPSAISFFHFHEIWLVRRGWVMHDGVLYDLIQVKVTRPSKLKIMPYSKPISSAIYNGSWQLTTNFKIFKLGHSI